MVKQKQRDINSKDGCMEINTEKKDKSQKEEKKKGQWI
jgi:hypothetical protein